MKKLLLLSIFSALTVSVTLAQSKPLEVDSTKIVLSQYSDFKVMGFSLPNFPKNVYKKPASSKVTRTKNGKLISYQEFNALGQPSGLFIEMQDNYVYPHHISYRIGFDAIYSAKFFGNSKHVQYIMNYHPTDKNHYGHGLQVSRRIENGELFEKLELYFNGKLIGFDDYYKVNL